MELAEFVAPRTFLEMLCAPRNKRLGIPMMKESCKKRIIWTVIFVQTTHIFTDICRHNL
jgi:hypothetical protein